MIALLPQSVPERHPLLTVIETVAAALLFVPSLATKAKLSEPEKLTLGV
jgi:hypothetical protein